LRLRGMIEEERVDIIEGQRGEDFPVEGVEDSGFNGVNSDWFDPRILAHICRISIPIAQMSYLA